MYIYIYIYILIRIVFDLVPVMHANTMPTVARVHGLTRDKLVIFVFYLLFPPRQSSIPMHAYDVSVNNGFPIIYIIHDNTIDTLVRSRFSFSPIQRKKLIAWNLFENTSL